MDKILTSEVTLKPGYLLISIISFQHLNEFKVICAKFFTIYSKPRQVGSLLTKRYTKVKKNLMWPSFKTISSLYDWLNKKKTETRTCFVDVKIPKVAIILFAERATGWHSQLVCNNSKLALFMIMENINMNRNGRQCGYTTFIRSPQPFCSL